MFPFARSPSLRSPSARILREKLVRYTMRLRVGSGSVVELVRLPSGRDGDVGLYQAHRVKDDSGAIGGAVGL